MDYKEYVGYVFNNELIFCSNNSLPWQPDWVEFLLKNEYTPNSYDIFHLAQVYNLNGEPEYGF